MSLFRSESITHATKRLNGTVIAVTSIPVWGLGGFCIVVLIASAAFLSVSNYSRKEAVTGWLVPEAGAVRASVLRSGVIGELLVEPGDKINFAQPIARVNLSVFSDEGDVGTSLKATLDDQVRAVSAQLEATKSRISAEHARLTQQRLNTTNEQDALAIELQGILERLADARETANWAQGNFEEGLTTRSDVENWDAVVRDLEQEKLRLQRTDIQYQSARSDLDQQISALRPELETAEANFGVSRAELFERLARVQSEADYVVTSPITGRVETLSAIQGQTVSSGTTIAVLTPADSPLIAELYVPSRAAGFVKPGQVVRLKYDAFPFQRFGTGKAEVLSVSRTILSPSEVSYPGPLSQEPVFIVRAKLDEAIVNAYGDDINLRSGMTLSADIIIDRRTLIEWLLDPLYAVKRR